MKKLVGIAVMLGICTATANAVPISAYGQKLAGDDLSRVVAVAEQGQARWQVSSTQIKIWDAQGNTLFDGNLFGSSLVDFADSGDSAAVRSVSPGARDRKPVLITQAMSPPPRDNASVAGAASDTAGQSGTDAVDSGTDVVDTGTDATDTGTNATDTGTDSTDSGTDAAGSRAPATGGRAAGNGGAAAPGIDEIAEEIVNSGIDVETLVLPDDEPILDDFTSAGSPIADVNRVLISEPGALLLWMAGLVALIARRR